jgi:uncharacterized membrane protein YedE/YeeE
MCPVFRHTIPSATLNEEADAIVPAHRSPRPHTQYLLKYDCIEEPPGAGDMTEFTPWSALAGGLLIGTAATILLWLNGRIAGVSGILNAVISRERRAWQVAFLAGILVGAAVVFYAGHGMAPAGRGTPFWVTALAGLLVGFGTTMGNGCTSGHGVCGLGRLSIRSLAATLMFLAAGMLTVYVVRHVLH